MEGITFNAIKTEENDTFSYEILIKKYEQQELFLQEKEQKIDALMQEIEILKEQLRLLLQKKYGKSSEKLTPNQLSLFDEDDETTVTPDSEDTEKETITYTRAKPKRPAKNVDTSALPREVKRHDLTASEKQCACGSTLCAIGQDTKEELIYIPATFKVIEHQRIKYACPDCACMKTPPAMELPLSKSKAGSALLAEVIVDKYDYHLPLYRQSQRYGRSGLAIPDNTLGGWVMGCAEVLSRLGEALWQCVSHAEGLQCDETPVKVLQPEKRGYMWLYHSFLPENRFVVFEFSLTRYGSVVDNRLEDFTGYLQTDGYSGYNKQWAREKIISLGCWDHCRRKFIDVIKGAKKQLGKKFKGGKASPILDKIAKLYEIERECKTLSFDKRKQQRQLHAKPLLKSIKEMVDKINAPPTSLLAKAVTYCKNQWPTLIVYVEHGEVEIANIWVENLVRPFAIGRRNWLFVGNELSATRGALLYSLSQSCKLNHINSRDYFTYVLTQAHQLRRKLIDPMSLLPHKIDKSLLNN